MTPKFTTPCYVRVEDKDKRKEICEQLERIGYGLGQFYIDMLDNMIITYPNNTFCTGMTGQFDEIDLKGCIDCGTNTELFLALAGMRSDTDMLQLFVYTEDSIMHDRGDIIVSTYDKYYTGKHRRATAAEIVEHFSQPTV